MTSASPAAGASRGSVLACITLAAAGSVARLVLAWKAPPSVDLQSYALVADILKQGQPLYETTNRYNDPPVWSSLSMAVKQVTAVRPLLWFRRSSGWPVKWTPYLRVAAPFLPYGRRWRAIVERVVLYRGVPRSYGFSELVLWDARWALPVGAAALLPGSPAVPGRRSSAVLAPLLAPFRDLSRASLFLFLLLLFFAPGAGAQYFICLGTARASGEGRPGRGLREAPAGDLR